MSDRGPAPRSDGELRIDKWLWHARFFKSRTQASKLCTSGKVRLNGTPVSKAHHGVKPGDVLIFPQNRIVRMIEVVALGTRRGPASEAQGLYVDLAPPMPRMAQGDADMRPARVAERDRGSGRPTKKERRETDRLRDG